jgi:hypothetical protein
MDLRGAGADTKQFVEHLQNQADRNLKLRVEEGGCQTCGVSR